MHPRNLKVLLKYNIYFLGTHLKRKRIPLLHPARYQAAGANGKRHERFYRWRSHVLSRSHQVFNGINSSTSEVFDFFCDHNESWIFLSRTSTPNRQCRYPLQLTWAYYCMLMSDPTGETPEEELLDLFTSHRSETWTALVQFHLQNLLLDAILKKHFTFWDVVLFFPCGGFHKG